jgi:hypothetical protein
MAKGKAFNPYVRKLDKAISALEYFFKNILRILIH